MSSLHPQDLTGQVTKTEKYPFATGGFADIWVAEWSRGIGTQIVALKVIRDISRKDDYSISKLLREGEVWNRLHHANVAPLYGIVFDQGRALGLVTAYFKNGNALEYLKANPRADRTKLVSQVAAGLAYLHDRRVVHGDMKAVNILMDDECNARIADFGLSRILEQPGFTTKSVAGTYRWMSNELIAIGDELEEQSIPRLTLASDVWAFGMTVLEIMSGKLPFFYLRSDAAVIWHVMMGQRPTNNKYPEINSRMWSVLEPCWRSDPAQRPSMQSFVFSLG